MDMNTIMVSLKIDVCLNQNNKTFFTERILPIYDNKIHSGKDPHNPYHNPKAPVHITTGSAGNRELHSLIHKVRKHYSAFIIEDYGMIIITLSKKT